MKAARKSSTFFNYLRNVSVSGRWPLDTSSGNKSVITEILSIDLASVKNCVRLLAIQSEDSEELQ